MNGVRDTSAVAIYVRQCGRLGSDPLSSREVRQLARLERAAKREWGEPIRVRRTYRRRRVAPRGSVSATATAAPAVKREAGRVPRWAPAPRG